MRDTRSIVHVHPILHRFLFFFRISKEKTKTIIRIAAAAFVCFSAAHLSFALPAVYPGVAPIALESGVALATILLFGYGAIPGVIAGIFLAYAGTAPSILAGVGLSAGTLAGVFLGAFLLNRFAHGARFWEQPRDILAFALFGGVIAPLVSMGAKLAVFSTIDFFGWRDIGESALMFFTADASAALILVPFLVSLSEKNESLLLKKRFEFIIVLFFASAALTGILFGPFESSWIPLIFLLAPLIAWVTFRFREREATMVIVALGSIAILRAANLADTSNESGMQILTIGGLLAVVSISTALTIALIRGYRLREKNLADALEDDDERLRRFAEMNAQRARLIDILGHELRNSLATITMTAELEDPRMADRRGHGLSGSLAIIRHQAGQMQRYIDDMVNATHVAHHTLSLTPEIIDLRDVVRQIAVTMDNFFKNAGQIFRVFIPDERLRICGDATRIEQILINLLNNSGKFTPRGGSIELSVETRDGWALIVVKDTGAGIDPDVLPHIFELFYRGDASQKKNGHHPAGIGIGLALSKELAELHGGDIRAKSEGSGHGAVFTVRLPLSEFCHDKQRGRYAALAETLSLKRTPGAPQEEETLRGVARENSAYLSA